MLTQQIINAIVIASGYILIGVSFSIVFRACGFLNMSHAVPYAVAPYLAFFIMRCSDISLLGAAFVGLALVAILSLFFEYLVFQPLRNKNATSLVMLLASLGIYVIFENIISLVFGDSPHPLQKITVTKVMVIFGANLTIKQMVLVIAAIVVASATHIGSRYTKIGLAFRAVTIASELARVAGLDSKRLIIKAALLGSVLAGLAGILSANDTNIYPSMGLQALFMGVVVVIVGGKESILGITLASILVSVAQTVGVWNISSQWQNAIVFAILLTFLIVKPEGLFGKKVKRAII